MAESAIAASVVQVRRWRPSGVPVLLYHGITGPGMPPAPRREGKFWITYSRFVDDLERIQAHGYRVAPLPELWWLAECAARTPMLAITFDDGRATDYSVAFPLLRKNGYRGDFFVNTATIGRAGYLGWEQIHEMHCAGMSIQSHSHHHVDLSRLAEPALRDQLRRSKQSIEDRLGHPVEFLSVPYGLVNQRVLEIAAAEGYRAVCSSHNWPAQLGQTPISRISIQLNTSRREFEGLLARNLSPYLVRMAREMVLFLPKQILLRLSPAMLTVHALGDLQ